MFAIGVGDDARRFRDRSQARSAQNELDDGLAEKSEIARFTSVLPHFGQVCAFSRSAQLPTTSKRCSYLPHVNSYTGMAVPSKASLPSSPSTVELTWRKPVELVEGGNLAHC